MEATPPPTMMDHSNLHHGKHSPKRLKMDEPVKTRRGPWTTEEDELLTTLVKRFGTKKWAIIAELVPGRVGKQCRERWLNHLRTDVKKTAWTDEEDEILIKAQQELGNRWSSIAKLLPGRPENSVKNRWNSLVNKKKRNAAEDTDNGNVSSDEQTSSDFEGSDDPSPPPPPPNSIPRRTDSFRMMQAGTPYADAKSLSVLPAMTPNSGSPVVGSSFPIKTDMVPPPHPLPQWSLYPPTNPATSSMLMRQHENNKLMMMHQQAGSRFPSYMIPGTPYISRKPNIHQAAQLQQQQQHHEQLQNTSNNTEDSKGAAQGLLLLATLCT